MSAVSSPPAIAIIGGSGLYDLDGFSNRQDVAVDTPWGPPSDLITTGTFANRKVCFLPRHGRTDCIPEPPAQGPEPHHEPPVSKAPRTIAT